MTLRLIRTPPDLTHAFQSVATKARPNGTTWHPAEGFTAADIAALRTGATFGQVVMATRAEDARFVLVAKLAHVGRR